MRKNMVTEKEKPRMGGPAQLTEKYPEELGFLIEWMPEKNYV